MKLMDWRSAFKAMLNGRKIKKPNWGGYWHWDFEKQTIMMHCKDGVIIDIRKTQDVAYTLKQIQSDDWIIATQENTPVLGGRAMFDFHYALTALEKGARLRRSSWDDHKSIVIKGIDEESYLFKRDRAGQMPYALPLRDILAKDWEYATI